MSYPINTLLTTKAIAMEALMVLENNLVLAGLIHRDYSKEFQAGRGATVTIRKPWEPTSGTVDGTVNMATAAESSVNVVLDTQLDLTVPIGDRELGLDIVSFSEQFIQPIMKAHAQAMDAQIAGRYIDIAGHFPVSSSASVSDVTNLRRVLNIQKVPMADRRFVLHPTVEAKYLPLEAFLHAEKRGDTQAIKDASMGHVLGFDFYMDQNIPTHTTGGAVAATATIQNAGAATAGGTAIKLKGMVATGTINAGDIFKYDGYDEWKVVTTAATCADGSATVSVQPPFINACVNSATVTFQQSHTASLAFHKNAFALVTAPLAPPLGGARAEVINYKGLSCRCVYGYEMMEKKNLMSIDILYGVHTLDRNLAARFSDAN
jgi:hypothetical protein